ncbi:MAG TPA: peptidoglycan DD-metalloendopeptidase family protein, partial [Candidatus Sulfotelmatobacter sp.]|nr:peptidoglycan DD-metalloendopeptidase family protein [Candidatus Sulfotelmatobacter sp.]
DANSKLQNIQQELEASKQKLKLTKEQQADVLGKLVVITQELRQANRKLTRAKGKIEENTSKIGEMTVVLRHTEEDLRQKADVLKKRVREAYKSGGANYLELLFASRSMADFLNRFYYFEKVIARDSKMIVGVKEDIQQTKVAKQVLSERNQEIKQLVGVIADEKQKIAEQAEEKKKALEELNQREEETVNKIAELEKSSRDLEVMIQKKMVERSQSGLVAHGSGTFIWPLIGRITSPYGAYRRNLRGHFHTGIDIAAPYGTPIMAADAGTVIFAGWWDGYGKAIVIDHGHGLATVYGHMSRLYPSAGATVAKGQTIGLEGSTGYSTGPHLHFEVRKNGVVQNPNRYLPK